MSYGQPLNAYLLYTATAKTYLDSIGMTMDQTVQIANTRHSMYFAPHLNITMITIGGFMAQVDPNITSANDAIDRLTNYWHPKTPNVDIWIIAAPTSDVNFANTLGMYGYMWINIYNICHTLYINNEIYLHEFGHMMQLEGDNNPSGYTPADQKLAYQWTVMDYISATNAGYPLGNVFSPDQWEWIDNKNNCFDVVRQTYCNGALQNHPVYRTTNPYCTNQGYYCPQMCTVPAANLSIVPHS